MREARLEKAVCEFARKHGWLAYKFVSPGNRGVPDRMFIKGGRVVFVEFKSPGKKPTRLQAETIRRIRQEGVPVHVCDALSYGRAIFEGGMH